LVRIKHTLQRTITPQRRTVTLVLALFVLAAGAGIAGASVNSPRDPSGGNPQDAPTDTPVQLSIPTEAPTATLTDVPSRTPTVSQERVLIEAISTEMETNVRAGPDIGDDRVGTIFPGTTYVVLGKRFEWYQIEFQNSPTGTAWVHESVVQIVSGDEDTIPELDPEAVLTIDPAFIAEQQTAEFIKETPGAAATLTAQVLITPTGVYMAEPHDSTATPPGTPPPTFTPMPATSTWIVVPKTTPAAEESSEGIPPIVPILALGALGLMGLLVGFLRRL
jgi:hypothetical protein